MLFANEIVLKFCIETLRGKKKEMGKVSEFH